MAGAAQSRYPSPLRYPGGKGKVANYVKLLLLKNGLIGTDYLEPYAGGASVALSLLFEEYVSTIWINDLNRSVHAFWEAVLDNPEELCERTMSVPLTVAEWEQQRGVQCMASPGAVDLAFSTFFLNRTNRSGIIAGGGVIGGKDQTGTWKIDARFNRAELCKRLRKIARYKSRIKLTRLDAAGLLADLPVDSSSSMFAYLDPPYYVKGEGLYDNFYSSADHANLAGVVKRLECKWMVSYDAAPEILKLYSGVPTLRYSLLHTARSSRLGAEAMFFSPGLELPDTESAAGVATDDVVRARHATSELL